MKNDQYHLKLLIRSFPSCIYYNSSYMGIDKIFWSDEEDIISTL